LYIKIQPCWIFHKFFGFILVQDNRHERISIFYGWWIVAAGFTIAMYISGFIHFSITALIEPINAEFNWGYAQVSLAASIRGIESSVVAPFIGVLVDRFGPRKLIVVGALCIGLGLLLLSRMNSLFLFYLSFIIIALGSSACIGVVPITTVGNWFRRNVTLATGILVSGTAMGGLLIPVATKLIDTYDWRMAVTIVGLGAWAILVPLAFLFRHKPEQFGYQPDSMAAEVDDIAHQRVEEVKERQVSAREALGTRAFWQITIGFMCHLAVMNAIITHIMPFLGSIGFARSTASFMAVAIPVISVSGRLGFGWLGDKYEKKLVTTTGLIFVLIAMVMMSVTSQYLIWLIYPTLVLAGIGYGGPVPMLPALMREHFGRFRLGTLLGISLGLSNMGAILTPPLTGLIYDRLHSYELAWIIMGGIILIGIISMMTIPAARKT
jgi:OFA family oxalate/formate antiporter-like MFS transporter